MSVDIYSDRAEERRRQFNKLINSCDMVLMNNITEVDPEIWNNFGEHDPTTPEDCEWFLNDSKPDRRWCCNTHMFEGDEYFTEDKGQPELPCEWSESDVPEVYQWFAVNSNDADFLERHGQYITYSDMLDTHFLAICHFGTSWDYTSMVDDFEDCYTGLDKFNAKKEATK